MFEIDYSAVGDSVKSIMVPKEKISFTTMNYFELMKKIDSCNTKCSNSNTEIDCGNFLLSSQDLDKTEISEGIDKSFFLEKFEEFNFCVNCDINIDSTHLKPNKISKLVCKFTPYQTITILTSEKSALDGERLDDEEYAPPSESPDGDSPPLNIDDTTPPITYLIGFDSTIEYDKNVTIKLICTDNFGTTGCTTYYKIGDDSKSYLPGNEFELIQTQIDTNYKIMFYSIDASGNNEISKTIYCFIKGKPEESTEGLDGDDTDGNSDNSFSGDEEQNNPLKFIITGLNYSTETYADSGQIISFNYKDEGIDIDYKIGSGPWFNLVSADEELILSPISGDTNIEFNLRARQGTQIINSIKKYIPISKDKGIISSTGLDDPNNLVWFSFNNLSENGGGLSGALNFVDVRYGVPLSNISNVLDDSCEVSFDNGVTWEKGIFMELSLSSEFNNYCVSKPKRISGNGYVNQETNYKVLLRVRNEEGTIFLTKSSTTNVSISKNSVGVTFTGKYGSKIVSWGSFK